MKRILAFHRHRSLTLSGALLYLVLCRALRGQIATAGPSASRQTDLPTLPPAMLTSQTDSVSKPMHVLLGRSVVIRTLTRLKRVYVSAPLVLDSFTVSPTEIVLTAKAPGVSSLILWDEDEQSQIYLVSVDTDTTQLQEEIRHAFPSQPITVTTQQDRITLSGTAFSNASSEAAAKIASLYGKIVVNSLVVSPPHLRQVRLKVQMIEINRTKLETFGINFLSQGKNTIASGTGQFPAVSVTTTTSTTGGLSPPTLNVSNPLNLLLYNSGLNIGLILQDLQNKQIAQILSEPTITTLSGQKASFLSGGEFPFPVVQSSSGGLASITIQFRPFGVKLDFTPFVNPDGTIQLTVAPEVSALDYSSAVTISGYTIPAISTRRAETQVELRDGQSFAISGLIDHRTIDIYNKMPGVGDIPILGKIFRSKSTTDSAVELVILVTPTLLDPLVDDSVPSLPKLPVPWLDPDKFDKTTVPQKPAAAPQPIPGGKP